MGTTENRSIAGLLAKSPYLRRLQNVCYFSDLSSILETSYEQHIIGTSKIMTKYSRALHRTYAQLTLKILYSIDKKIREENREAEVSEEYKNYASRLFLFYNKLIDEYEERLSKVGEVSSIIGMLAIPPFRRPYGTPLKRTYIKLIIDKLYDEIIDNECKQDQNNICLKSIIESIGKKFADLYTSLYECEYNNNQITCTNNIIRPLEWLNFLNEEETSQLKIEIVKSIRDHFDNIFNLNKYQKKPEKFRRILRSSTFLIKYRTLSVILGLAYTIDSVLRYLVSKIATGQGPITLGDLRDVADVLFLTGESALVNHMASLSYPLDFYFVYIKKKNSKPDDKPEGYLAINFYGARGFIPGSVFRSLATPRTNILEALENIGFKQEYEIALDEAEKVAVCNEPVENDPFNNTDKCKIIDINDKTNSEDSVLDATNPAEPFKGHHAFCCLFRASYKDPDRSKFILTKEEPYTVLVRYFLGIDSDEINMALNGDWSIFVTYDWLNLVQNDHLPSAYQLDLLQKLAKDTNIGYRISYDVLDDLVLNISQYQYLTLNLLNTIYTFLLSDDTTIIHRTNLVLLGKQPIPGCEKLTRIEAFAYIYFNLLVKEFRKYSSLINEKIEILNSNNNIVKYILTLANKIKELLDEYSELLETVSYLGKYREIREEKECWTIRELINNLDFNSLIDSQIIQILKLGDLATKKNKSRKEILVPIRDSFVHLAASSHLSDYFSELVNLMSWELTKLQFIDSERINKVVNYILRKHLDVKCEDDNNKGCDEDEEAIELYITIPIQGVLKPFSHAMDTPTIFPLMVSMLREEHILKLLEEPINNNDVVSETYKELYEEAYERLHDILCKFSSLSFKNIIDNLGMLDENRDLGFAYIPARGHDQVLPTSLLSDAATYTVGGAGLFRTQRIAEQESKTGLLSDKLVYITATPVTLIYSVFIKDWVLTKKEWSALNLYEILGQAISRAIFTNINNIKI